MAQGSAPLGYAVWMPDYPGMGDAPGIQPCCDPGSLARSTLDGLAAARSYLDSQDSSGYTESGRLYVIGYSEGGLAAMAIIRAIERRTSWTEAGGSAPPRRLTLMAEYPMGAPLNLSLGFAENLANDKPVENPAYVLLLFSGFARIHPQSVILEDIIRDDVRSSILPLLGETKNANEINRDLAAVLKIPQWGIRAADMLKPGFIADLKSDARNNRVMRVIESARMDRWEPEPGIPMTLAASRRDKLVLPENSEADARSPGAPVPPSKKPWNAGFQL